MKINFKNYISIKIKTYGTIFCNKNDAIIFDYNFISEM